MEVGKSIAIWLSITECNRENPIVPLIFDANYIKLLEKKEQRELFENIFFRFLFFVSSNLHRHEVDQNDNNCVENAKFGFASNWKR